MRVRQLSLILAAISANACGLANTASAKTLRFWNLTRAPIVELYLAPVGTAHWSGNLCRFDPDHAVDADERLNMPGVSGGIYDVRLTDKDGRACTLHAVQIHIMGPYSFAVSEAQMKSCAAH